MDRYRCLFRFDKKVAVITGAAGILGKEFCKALCSLGVTVICIDVEIEPLKRLVQELNEYYESGSAQAFACDVSNQATVNEIVSEIIQKFNKIDILLNNAATKTKNLSA